MKISGILPLRNGAKLNYPFELAIRSLRPLCDEVIIGVDPTSEDDTLARVQALPVDRIVESVWDMNNHRGHDGQSDEIARQTDIVLAQATGDWVISLQADEVMHEKDINTIRSATGWSELVTGLEMKRLYFYGGLDRYRSNWTTHILRFFKRGCWLPDYASGAMQFVPVGHQLKDKIAPRIYHYSRVGDPKSVAARVQNLDRFYHSPETIADVVPEYDYKTMRRQDTYVLGASTEVDEKAHLVPFDINLHPAGVRGYFGE